MVKSKNKKLNKWYFLLLIIVIILISFTIFWYNDNLQKNLSRSVSDTLSEITEQQRFNVSQKYSSDTKTLKNIAIVLGEGHYDDKKSIQTFLNTVKENTNIDNILWADLKGQGFAANGTPIDISDRFYFHETLSGKTVIDGPFQSKIRDTIVTTISTPIVSSSTGEIIGVLGASNTVDTILDYFLPSFNGDGVVSIIDTSGNIIVSTNNGDSALLSGNKVGMQRLDEIIFKSSSYDELRDNLNSKNSGFLQFNNLLNNELYYTYYLPVGINDWYLFSTVQHDVIASTAKNIQFSAAVVAVVIILILILLLTFIYFLNSRHNKALGYAAKFDKLTGLPNSETFKELIDEAIVKNPNHNFSCIVFDIVGFKLINDEHGFEIGDKILKSLAKSLTDFSKTEPEGTCVLSRLYSDTFSIFFCSDGNSTRQKNIDTATNEFAKFSGIFQENRLDLSIGRYKAHKNDTAVTIYEKALIAHSKAQAEKPNTILDYDEVYRDRLKADHMVRNNIDFALKNDEFKLFLQPKYNLLTQEICGAEALARWLHGKEYLSPAEFIPILEKTYKIIDLDMFMFEKCCKVMSQWRKDGRTLIPVSVNFSRHHTQIQHFAYKLKTIADKYGIPPEYLVIEFTETVVTDYHNDIKNICDCLHKFGFTLSMDDFGSGYSSLGFLDDVMVDEIKLDRSLVENIDTSIRTQSIVRAIIGMASELNIGLVAEGIETRSQAEKLKSIGCNIIQGYYISTPKHYKEFFNN